MQCYLLVITRFEIGFLEHTCSDWISKTAWVGHMGWFILIQADAARIDKCSLVVSICYGYPNDVVLSTCCKSICIWYHCSWTSWCVAQVVVGHYSSVTLGHSHWFHGKSAEVQILLTDSGTTWCWAIATGLSVVLKVPPFLARHIHSPFPQRCPSTIR